MYIQLSGVSMGNSLGPIAACLYMDCFEESVFNLAKERNIPYPSMWYRYVDDVLARWEYSSEELKSFLSFLNAMVDSISFTMELEDNKKLSFLDLMIDKSQGMLFFLFIEKQHIRTRI